MNVFSRNDLHFVGGNGGEGSPTEPISGNQPIQPSDIRTQSDETVMGSTTAQATSLHSEEYRHHQQNEEATLRSRFPSTQEAGNREADESERSLSIRLILPNNSTLPVNVQLSMTLGEMRRYKP